MKLSMKDLSDVTAQVSSRRYSTFNCAAESLDLTMLPRHSSASIVSDTLCISDTSSDYSNASNRTKLSNSLSYLFQMFPQPCHCTVCQVNVRCLAQQFVSRCYCHKSCPSCRICVRNFSIHHFLLHSFSTDYTVTSSELASWAMHCTTIRRDGRSLQVSMWWLSRPRCQVENRWNSTDLSHSYGETLSPEVHVKEVSPTLDVSLLPAGSATRGRGRSALFPSDTLFAPSKSRLEIVQINGISARCIQSGRASMADCACCSETHWHPPQPSTRVVKTHTMELSWDRQNCGSPHEHKQGWTFSRTDEKQNDEGAAHTLTGTCTHDKISVEGDARPIRHCSVLTGPPLSWLVLP